jgi:hypothetical protein
MPTTERSGGDWSVCEGVVLGGFLSSLIIASGSISMMRRSSLGPGFRLRFGLDLFGFGIMQC